MKWKSRVRFAILLMITACSRHTLQQNVERGNTLTIAERHTVDLPEISGLSWAPMGKNPEQGRKLLMVGDRFHSIAFLTWAPDRPNHLVSELKVATDSKTASLTQSQWESVYSDSSGKIFVLEESPGRIFVFDSYMKHLLHTIELQVSPEWDQRLGWSRDSNSKGEGILLLKNGHILILKEKKPVTIIEFSPKADAAPQGYHPTMSIEFSGSFPIVTTEALGTSIFVPVHSWVMEHGSKSHLPDASGINVGPRGELYLLSDKGRRIGRINELRPESTEFGITKAWDLPTEIRKPEGMVFDPSGRVFITSDDPDSSKPGFFVIDALQ